MNRVNLIDPSDTTADRNACNYCWPLTLRWVVRRAPVPTR